MIRASLFDDIKSIDTILKEVVNDKEVIEEDDVSLIIVK